MKERIAVFIDGGSFFFLQKDELRWWVDPSLLLDWIHQMGQITDAIYYAGFDPSDTKQIGYLKALSHVGFSLVTKEVKFNDKEGRPFKRVNMDCDIVADMFCMKDQYDTAILVSGGADLATSLKKVRTAGKSFRVISSGHFVSNEIREVAGNRLIDFQDIRQAVEKPQRR
jgi:uncharacterized LabA/DUF88 family protein